MKEHIDFFETYKAEFLGGLRFRNRLVKYWGTETVDGVEVMKSRFTIYPGTTTNTNIRKVCKLFGSWSDIKSASEDGDFSTVAGYYFYFNYNKELEVQEALDREILAEQIDKFCPVGEWKYATINYIDVSDPSKFTGWTKDQILTYIDNDYRKIFDYNNGYVIGDTIEESALGKYVLFDDDGEFYVEPISSSITAIPLTSSVLGNIKKQVVNTGLSIEIKFKRVSLDIDPEGSLINAIKEEQDEQALKILAELQNSLTAVDYGYNADAMFGGAEAPTDAVWYKGQLRLSAIKDNGVPIRDAVLSIVSTLDTGYIKKKVKWYKKLLGPILIIIAIVLAFVTAGTSLAAVGALTATQTAALLTTIALYVGISVAVMGMIAAKWAKTNAAAGEYMGRWIKIGSIISTVTGIAGAIGAMFAEAGKQALITEIAKSSGTTVAAATTTVNAMSAAQISAVSASLNIGQTQVMNAAIDLMINSITSSWKSIAFKVANMAVSSRTEDMESKISSKDAIIAQQKEEAEAAEADKNSLISIEDIRIYADCTDRIWTRYDYDAQYGAEYATIHVGNICKSSGFKSGHLNLRAEDLV